MRTAAAVEAVERGGLILVRAGAAQAPAHGAGLPLGIVTALQAGAARERIVLVDKLG